jgi:hypothetical protein
MSDAEGTPHDWSSMTRRRFVHVDNILLVWSPAVRRPGS